MYEDEREQETDLCTEGAAGMIPDKEQFPRKDQASIQGGVQSMWSSERGRKEHGRQVIRDAKGRGCGARGGPIVFF